MHQRSWKLLHALLSRGGGGRTLSLLALSLLASVVLSQDSNYDFCTGHSGAVGHFGDSRRLDWSATVDGPGGKGLVFTSYGDGNKTEARAATTQPWGNLILAGRVGPESAPKGYIARYCWVIGDVDGDGTVDDTDLALILDSFGQPADGLCDPLDLDESGAIDDSDLAIVLDRFGNTCNG